jgi:hypothetical protein
MPYYKEECKFRWFEEEECSSIKIKSKERHKITSRILRHSLWTFGSRKSRHLVLEVLASIDLATSPPARTFARRKSWLPPKVLTPWDLASLARLVIGSPDESQKSRLPEVPAFCQESRLWLCWPPLTAPRTVFCRRAGSPGDLCQNFWADLNDWISTMSINSSLLSSNHYPLIHCSSTFIQQLLSIQGAPLLSPLLQSSIPLGFWVKGEWIE